MSQFPGDLEQQFAAIAATGYVGWVVWVDQGGRFWQPIFESRLPEPRRPQIIREARDRPEERAVRRPDRQTMDWRQIRSRPSLMHSVQLLAVFAFHGIYTHQPLIVIQRNSPGAWFLQYKTRGVQVQANVATGEETGQQRTGVIAFTTGYWDAALPFTYLVQATPKGRTEKFGKHPCWPAPHGFGLNPAMCGLKPEEVPDCPYIQVPLGHQMVAVDSG